MNTLADLHIETHRQGSTDFYKYRYNPPRGFVTILHDSKIYVYKGIRRSQIKTLRNAIKTAWCCEIANAAKLTGTFPHYALK